VVRDDSGFAAMLGLKRGDRVEQAHGSRRHCRRSAASAGVESAGPRARLPRRTAARVVVAERGL
jgi:hypothetical protein